jgi:hypothetical protein
LQPQIPGGARKRRGNAENDVVGRDAAQGSGGRLARKRDWPGRARGGALSAGGRNFFKVGELALDGRAIHQPGRYRAAALGLAIVQEFEYGRSFIRISRG